MKATPQMIAGLAVAGAAVSVLLAVLYGAGVLNILASDNGHHYKHAVAFGLLAVVLLVAANIARQRSAADQG